MSLFTLPVIRATDANGRPLPGAELYFYESGTLDPADVYTTDDLDTAHSNPVEANSGGLFPAIYLDPDVAYRAVLKTAAGVEVQDIDPYDATSVYTPASGEGLSRSVQAKLRDTISVKDYGAVGDGVTDDTDAFEAAIYTARPDLDRLRIFIPEGDYLLSRQIIPRRQLHLVGAGNSTSRLIFHNVASINATMKGALSFGLAATLTAYTTPSAYPVAPTDSFGAGGADYSTITDLAIEITGARPAGFDYAVWSAARIDGFRVMASLAGFKLVGGNLEGGGTTITGNSNSSTLTTCRSLNATEHGFVIDGSDANSITLVGCNSYRSAGANFYDLSFLGNSYIGCGSDSGTYGFRAVSSGWTNVSTFAGCYVEENASVQNWDLVASCIVTGPQGAIPAALSSNRNIMFRGTALGLWINRPIIIADTAALVDTVGNAGNGAIKANKDGIYIRGTDGLLYSIERAGGDGVYLQRNGVAVQKFQLGAAIPNLTVTATSGSLPTANGSVTIADAAAPTVVELLELCMEIKAKQDAALATMRALKPTIAT